jgi:HJR/Mrr/RecB family endonuclease
MTDSSDDKRNAGLGGQAAQAAQAAMRGYLFEQLVAELLSQLGFSDVRLAGSGPDQGIDILATYPSIQPTGEQVPQLWAVQVKHRRSRLGAADIAQLSGMFQVKGADKALLVTSSNLTSAAREYLSKFQNQLGHRLEIWDRDRLVSLLSRFPGLLEKYKELGACPRKSEYSNRWLPVVT